MNNTELITYISIAVIAISLFSIGTQMTGHATTEPDTGVVNVTVATNAAINFTTDFIDFGVGSVNAGQSSATLDTEGTNSSGSWSSMNTPLVIENIGNTNVSLGIKADKTAATFIGGSSPSYQYKITETTEAGSCGDRQTAGTDWTDFTTSDVAVCNSFIPDSATDVVELQIKLVIPSDSNVGNLTSTVTATGTYA